MAIKKCTCKNEFQDQRYGNGMRVMNASGASGKADKVRCTVCSKEYNVSSGDTPAK